MESWAQESLSLDRRPEEDACSWAWDNRQGLGQHKTADVHFQEHQLFCRTLCGRPSRSTGLTFQLQSTVRDTCLTNSSCPNSLPKALSLNTGTLGSWLQQRNLVRGTAPSTAGGDGAQAVTGHSVWVAASILPRNQDIPGYVLGKGSQDGAGTEGF